MRPQTILHLATGVLIATSLASAASAADRINVAIGHKGIWDSMIMEQCVQSGICGKAGLDVHTTWTAGGSETLQAAITGSTDLAMTNGTLGVLAAYSRGAPIRIITAEATGTHDMFWYVLKDSPIKTLKNAKGYTMGFSSPGSSTNLAELELVKQFNADIKLLPAGGISATRTQVLSKQIDIGWSVPPFNLNLVQEGKIRIIARGGEIRSLQDETVRVNVANLNFLKQRRDVAIRFAKAYGDTINWMYANLDKSLALYAKINKIDIKTARHALEFYPKHALNPARLVGLDRVNHEAVALHKMDKLLTKKQLGEVVDLLAK
jgi:NitT/TauT family transport system substrate-binding protein